MRFTPTNPLFEYMWSDDFRQWNQTQSHGEKCRLQTMPEPMIQSIDHFFPYFVLFYGALVTFMLEIPLIRDLASKQKSDAFQQLLMRREFALTCLIVGSLWSLQNLWIL